MRFTYAEAMTDPANYIPLAKAADEAGYHAMTIADSVAYPEVSDSKYPYTADGNREFLDGKPFIETFALIGALSAVTTNLHFNIFVLKLPIRPPALVAKQAGSLAAMFGNRLNLGVGTSPWPEDYDFMGVDFRRRGKRMDECMDIIRGLTTGEYFEFHGEFYDIPRIKLTPAPTQPLPILVGGSGLYVRGALDRLEFPGESPAIRARLYAELLADGSEALHARLAALAEGASELELAPYEAIAILAG